MNRKRLGLISAMACLICVILVIFVNAASTRTIRVAGQDVECRIRNRKLTIEDFEAIEIDEDIYESDLEEQIGKPDGYLPKEIGEPNISGVGTMVYVLEDGRTVVPFLGFINPTLCALVIYEGDNVVGTIKEKWEIASDEICVCGWVKKCPPEDRKWVIEDFNDVELWDTRHDLAEKVGEESFWTGSGVPGDQVYVLQDGRCVIPSFMNDYLYGIFVYKGDSIDDVLKAVDKSDIREVYYNEHTLRYVSRHRNLTVEDFENIELGTPPSKIMEKIGEQDALSRDSETGNRTMLFVLEDDRVAECYLSKDDEIVYLEKIVIYDGDDVDLVIGDTE